MQNESLWRKISEKINCLSRIVQNAFSFSFETGAIGAYTDVLFYVFGCNDPTEHWFSIASKSCN